jgi:hypothetical protein
MGDSKKLIEMAQDVPFQFHYEIDALIRQAPDKETTERLRSIQRLKRLQTERHCSSYN